MKPLFILLLTAAALHASPQTVVFDFGGVLTGKPNREILVHFLYESLQLSESEFEKANLEKRQAVKEGQTDEEFWLRVASQKGLSLGSRWPSDFRSAMKESIGINPSMFAMVAELKAKNIRVVLLSNIDERLAKIIRNLGFYEPFDPCLLSYEMGVEKPGSRAYEILLEKLRCPAADIVFIDDRAENIEAALEMGLDAILFESPLQVREVLQVRGLL